MSCENNPTIQDNQDDKQPPTLFDKYGTTWKKSDSPIYIDNIFLLPKDSVLNIEAGVTVILKTSNKSTDREYYDNPNVGIIHILGTIIAQGTETDSIYFLPDTIDNGGWGSIMIQDSKDLDSYFSYCRIEGGRHIIFEDISQYYTITDGALDLNNSSAVVENSRIIDSYVCGVVAQNESELLIKNSIISNDTTISDICNSITSVGNYWSGILCGDQSTIISINNIIKNNLRGISIYGGYFKGIGNLIANNRPVGIYVRYTERDFVKIINCTLTKNCYGLYAAYEGKANLFNCILWDNTLNIHDYASATSPFGFFTFFQCNYENNEYINPVFVDELNKNYLLDYTSPCIDSGDGNIDDIPEFDLLGNPRIIGNDIDLGAYECF